MSAPEKHFGFSQVTILKEEKLGRGAYGSVCKARCDTLMCAAKVMHPILFDFDDPGVGTTIRRFQQECEILSGIKHPNVVQYLGTCTDTDNSLPVLLMELMDNSLTHFLEGQTETLLLHTQVNFSLDIALALAYLHSNNIQHRDLSSNNILLLGEERAKVTDFGMSRLEKVNSRMTPATMCCPGTLHYMPPEALKENPHYTDKLDVFSFGVLLIQIMTREFPKPTERFTAFQVPDPKNKKRLIEVQALVKEAERRQNHIGLARGNPLLETALKCINDEHKERPSANQLCGELKATQTSDAYRESAEAKSYRVRYDKLRGDFDREKVALRKANTDLGELRGQSSRAEEVFNKLLDDKDYVIQEKDRIIKAQEERLTPASELCLQWRGTVNAPVKFKGRGHAAVVGDRAYFHELEKKGIFQYDTKCEKWDSLPDAPVGRGFTLVAIHDLFLTTVGGYGNTDGKLHTYISKGEKWVERFPCIGSTYIDAFAASTRDSVIVIGKSLHRGNTTLQDSMTGHVLDLQTLEWTSFQASHFSPTIYHSAFMFVSDDTLYHAAGCDLLGPSDAFYSCPVSEIKQSSAWKKLHGLPEHCQTPVAFRGQILALGGATNHNNVADNSEKIKTVYRYNVERDTWEKCGEMDRARSNCMLAVVGGGQMVVVVGGDSSTDETSVTSVATMP